MRPGIMSVADISECRYSDHRTNIDREMSRIWIYIVLEKFYILLESMVF